MKNILKKTLGQSLIVRIRTAFPSKVGKESIKQEKQEIKARAAFYKTFVHHNELCFDVGANFGNRVAPLLEIGARVVAVEPQEQCYTFLKSKFGKRIDVVTKGLGESAGVEKFRLSSGPQMSSFSQEWIASVKDGRFAGYNWDREVLVEMTTLDNLITQYGVPAFIKIDVEGYELEVLKGLNHGVKMISFEYTVPEQIQRPLLCIDQIKKSNFNIECNYSIAESMAFAKDTWMSSDEMKNYMLTEEFISTGFGDVYVRSKS